MRYTRNFGKRAVAELYSPLDDATPPEQCAATKIIPLILSDELSKFYHQFHEEAMHVRGMQLSKMEAGASIPAHSDQE